MDDARAHGEGDREDSLLNRRREGTMGHDQNRCSDPGQSEQDILACGSNVQRKGDEDVLDENEDEVDHGVLGGGDHEKGEGEMVEMKMTMGG